MLTNRVFFGYNIKEEVSANNGEVCYSICQKKDLYLLLGSKDTNWSVTSKSAEEETTDHHVQALKWLDMQRSAEWMLRCWKKYDTDTDWILLVLARRLLTIIILKKTRTIRSDNNL